MVVYEGAKDNSTPPPPPFIFHKILSREFWLKKPWVIPYPCHLVPLGEKECQPNVKREVMIHLGSEENHFPPPHPHFTVDFSPLPSLNLSFCYSCCH